MNHILLAAIGVIVIALLMWALSRGEADDCYTGQYGPLDWDDLWKDMRDEARPNGG